MSDDTIQYIATLIFLAFFIGMIVLSLYIGTKIPLNHELKKIEKLKPNNKIINIEPTYKEKLKNQIFTSVIIVLTILIICIICKLFGFSVKDIADLF